jgi:Flp pilus assembly protein TadG
MKSFLGWMRDRGERGAVAVEMAFVMPLLALFLIGSLQVGLVVVGSSTASNGAREGARAASIRYECADNHISARCPLNPSTNYTFIKNAVLGKLAGLVQTSGLTVTVTCRSQSATGAVVTCERGYVDPDTDVVVVAVGWRHIGATPYIADQVHTNTARAVIIGRPDLSLLAPEPDTTAPAVLDAYIYDTNTDGILDQIKVTFSEDIEQTINKARFTITNSVTGSSTIATATVLNRVATITLSGGSTVNTAPGAMRISLTAASDGIRDLWGNQASFTNQVMTDAAKPILVGLSDTNGLTNGYPGILPTPDTLTLQFSEPIATTLTTSTVSYSDPSGGGNSIDTISLSSISAGPMTTNSQAYVSSDGATVTVSGVVSKSGNNVIVTVLAPLTCSPALCTGLGTGNDSSVWTFTPATTLVDAAGNTATGTKTISNLF